MGAQKRREGNKLSFSLQALHSFPAGVIRWQGVKHGHPAQGFASLRRSRETQRRLLWQGEAAVAGNESQFPREQPGLLRAALRGHTRV